MTDFAALFPGNTYKDVLHVDNSGNGVDATLRDVEDGAGVNTAMQLSTLAIHSTGSFSGPNFYGKNFIDNGNFNIWQRGTSVGTANNEYGTDRWVASISGTGGFSQDRSTSVPNEFSEYSLQVNVSTADATIAAGDVYTVVHKVEGYNFQRAGFGAAGASDVALSFWARSPKTGIHCVALQSSSGGRSYVKEYTIAVADTWEKFTMTIPGDTSGTWLKTAAIGCELHFCLANGATRQGAADTWTGSDIRSTSNQVNVMDNVANNFHLSQVQLEIGKIATTFEQRPHALELVECQRHAWVVGSVVDANFGTGFALSTTQAAIFLYPPTTFRQIPTLTLIGVVGDFDLNDGAAVDPVTGLGLIAGDTTPDLIVLSAGAAAITAQNPIMMYDDGAGNAGMIFEADL
jgi:hypothetical protein